MTLDEQAQKSAEVFWSDAGNYCTDRNFHLGPESQVIDVGGYLGDSTAYYVNRYDCAVNVYEPVLEFHQQIVKRFFNNRKVKVFNYGLEGRTYRHAIANMNENSSMYYPHNADAEIVQIYDIAHMSGCSEVDLMMVNGEGCEYKLLDRLLSTGKIRMYRNLLVQFHTFYPDAEKLRCQIRTNLAATHSEKFCYPFVWEAWSRKS